MIIQLKSQHRDNQNQYDLNKCRCLFVFENIERMSGIVVRVLWWRVVSLNPPFTAFLFAAKYNEKAEKINKSPREKKNRKHNQGQCCQQRHTKSPTCSLQIRPIIKSHLFWLFNIFNCIFHNSDYSTKYAAYANAYQNYAVIFNGGQK